MSPQLFLSHTKLDKDFCDRFDIGASRVGLKLFRSEFENIKTPAWATIMREIEKSRALLVFVGKDVKAQSSSDSAERQE